MRCSCDAVAGVSDIRHVAVIDIGKTNAKLALVDLSGKTVDRITFTPRPRALEEGEHDG